MPIIIYKELNETTPDTKNRLPLMMCLATIYRDMWISIIPMPTKTVCLCWQKIKGIVSGLFCPVVLSIWLNENKEEISYSFCTILSFGFGSTKNKQNFGQTFAILLSYAFDSAK